MKIAPGVFRLDHSRFSHIYYLPDEEALIDTGLPFRAGSILNELAALGGSVKNILLTHHDVDHVGNVRRIEAATGAAVWIGIEDAPFLLGKKYRPGRKRIIEALLRVDPPTGYTAFPAGTQSRIGNVDVIPAPGHTPGHHGFRYKNILFSGDIFRENNGRITGMSETMNWDNEAARRSIGLLSTIDFEIVCPSHGDPVEKGAALIQFIEGVQQL
jgi:glyoxylase-like metal-dependent hydrolase (beta-lactamase superfamily II)